MSNSSLVHCPQCNAGLKSSQPLPEGTRVKCRKCGTKFVVAPVAIAAAGYTSPEEAFVFNAPASAISAPPALEAFAFDLPEPKPSASAFKPASVVATPATPLPPSVPGRSSADSISLAPEAARANPLVLVSIVAGVLLFVGLGVTLAVVCLNGGGKSDSSDPDKKLLANGPDDDSDAGEKPITKKNLPSVPETPEKKTTPAILPSGEKPANPEPRPMGEKPATIEPAPMGEKPPSIEPRPMGEKPRESPEEKPVEPNKNIQKQIDPIPDNANLDGAKKLGPYLVTAGVPKPVSDKVKKAIAWLVSKQRKDGGWGEGGFGGFGGFGGKRPAFGPPRGGKEIDEKSNVAESAIATMVLIRAGNTPKAGKYSQNIIKAIDFVCSRVEKSDQDSLGLTKVEDKPQPVNPRIKGGLGGAGFGKGGFGAFANTTTVQRKIGENVDTFLATLMLSEVKNNMPTLEGEERVGQALAKLIHKIEKNQGADGSLTPQGQMRAWAPVLGQALATKAINRARQAGADVKEEVLERAKKQAEKSFDTRTNTFNVDAMAAGVALYSTSGNFASLQDSVNTSKAMEKHMTNTAASASLPADRQLAMTKLAGFKKSKKTQAQASKVVIKNLSNARFIQGFGNNGGEEFLSYMNISEALAVKGGKDWADWSKKMSVNLGRVQNTDGSWSGHHCITGKTFCTAAALLSLMADRSPVPLAAKNAK